MSADQIALAEFKEKLGKYPELIKRYNKEPTKEGQLSLVQLDQFRYVEAPSQFSKKAGGKSLGLSDIQKLVDWKIRHGVFRPTLPKLVASNKEDNVTTVLTEAFELYAKDPSDIKPTITKIAELKGIGPATASLILAIHDPEQIIFFSDECYRWLVHGGETVVPKYTFAEFDELHEKAKAFIAKLGAGITPLDIEKVAYVVMKENEPVKEKKPKPGPTGNPRGRPKLADHEKKPKKESSDRGPGRPKGTTKVAAPKTPNGTGKRGRPRKTEEAKEEETQQETTGSPTQTTTPLKSTKRKAADEAEKSAKKAKA